MAYSRVTNELLRKVNSELDDAVRLLDTFDYESLGIPGFDAQMTKVYQAIFAAGDAVNVARHINLKGN